VLEGREANPWKSHTYRPYHARGEKEFGEWVVMQTWDPVEQAQTANGKAEAYQTLVMGALNKFFPLKTVKRREKEHPWINDTIRRLDKSCKKLFKRVGRTDEWKELRQRTDELTDERRAAYLAEQKAKLTAPEASRNFYATIKNFKARKSRSSLMCESFSRVCVTRKRLKSLRASSTASARSSDP
jgi:hypothetical protein